MYSRFFWVKRFLFQALVWSVVLMFGFGLLFAFWYPASRWLFADGWHWMPMKKWISYVIVGIPGGIFAGAIFTMIMWLEYGGTGGRKRIFTSLICILLIIGFLKIATLAIPWFVDFLSKNFNI